MKGGARRCTLSATTLDQLPAVGRVREQKASIKGALIRKRAAHVWDQIQFLDVQKRLCVRLQQLRDQPCQRTQHPEIVKISLSGSEIGRLVRWRGLFRD